MHDLSSYAFSPLRDGDLALYRGAGAGLPPILLVAAENGSRAALRRLEHEYEIATQLDAAGAATLLSLTHHEGRTVLILGDPGGEPLARVLGDVEFIGAVMDVTAIRVAERELPPSRGSCGMALGRVRPSDASGQSRKRPTQKWRRSISMMS